MLSYHGNILRKAADFLPFFRRKTVPGSEMK